MAHKCILHPARCRNKITKDSLDKVANTTQDELISKARLEKRKGRIVMMESGDSEAPAAVHQSDVQRSRLGD